jgi:hypothetical protein
MAGVIPVSRMLDRENAGNAPELSAASRARFPRGADDQAVTISTLRRTRSG